MDDDKTIIINDANRTNALLTIIVSAIHRREDKGLEDQHGINEINAVLQDIRLILFMIPFKIHRRNREGQSLRQDSEGT